MFKCNKYLKKSFVYSSRAYIYWIISLLFHSVLSMWLLNIRSKNSLFLFISVFAGTNNEIFHKCFSGFYSNLRNIFTSEFTKCFHLQQYMWKNLSFSKLFRFLGKLYYTWTDSLYSSCTWKILSYLLILSLINILT